MRTRLAVILIVVAIAAVAFVVIRFPTPRRPAPPAPAPRPKPQAAAATPREAVVRYVDALYEKDFRAAYELLSTESRQVHPYDEFAQLAESGGSTSLDVAGAQEGPETNGRVVVSVPVEEDPAEAGFTTVKEAGGWKVVYIGGAPWFPYPEQENSGAEG
jgi:hypothetical protein